MTELPPGEHAGLQPCPNSVAAQVTVVRSGRSQEIEQSELLVGDLLVFGAGDILAADGLVCQASDVK